MPTYTFENIDTGERFDKIVKLSEREQYLKDNPHLKIVISAPRIVSGVGSLQSKSDDGFNDLLKEIKKGSGKVNSINTK